MQDKRYTVPALERGLRLLGEFSRQDRVLGAPELARRLNIPRSTVFRMLNTLETLGFVRKADGGAAYRLDTAVLRLGFEYLASLELTDLGRPLLERLRDATGYSTNLVVRDRRSAVVVAKVSAPTPFVSTVFVGTRLPTHATLLGRAVMCDLSLPELFDLYGADPLPPHSAHTPRSVPALHALLQKDLARGYVIERGFYEAIVGSIAAPVRDASGRVIAALGVTIPTLSPEEPTIDEASVIHAVCAAANELSASLDYVPPLAEHNVVSGRT
ncbi:MULTISPECIES: IclR family transcriptional regulator [Achromobacter]|uniref:IclR family transcriptional regulator n=1 Tax=Achromobacter spanius TaxID=217203 RepID=A0AAW3I0G2_9BURK|nr:MULTISPECIES: IclR family transcriptional regulator [Achromobacter]KNE26320.1 IclR family transcriptional regulator [Achromobacter spanius]MCD0496374.1 IclR family transcriptional regulator [Achromobacter sp. MY14]